MDKKEMYNTMSIYKQRLHEIDENITNNEYNIESAKGKLTELFIERAGLKKPSYLKYLLITLGLAVLSFINIPVFVASLALMVGNSAHYLIKQKYYYDDYKAINNKIKDSCTEITFLMLEKNSLESERKFVIDNIELFEDFVFCNKVPTSDQEEKMHVSKSLAKAYQQIDEEKTMWVKNHHNMVIFLFNFFQKNALIYNYSML